MSFLNRPVTWKSALLVILGLMVLRGFGGFVACLAGFNLHVLIPHNYPNYLNLSCSGKILFWAIDTLFWLILYVLAGGRILKKRNQ